MTIHVVERREPEGWVPEYATTFPEDADEYVENWYGRTTEEHRVVELDDDRHGAVRVVRDTGGYEVARVPRTDGGVALMISVPGEFTRMVALLSSAEWAAFIE